MPSLVRRSLGEAVGTFFLVLLGPGAIMVDEVTNHSFGGPVGVAFATAFGILAVVYALGRASGAHVNPAVTIALWSRRRFRGRDVPAYLVAQCAGAVLAILVLRWIVGPVASLGASLPAMPAIQSLAVEFLLSFLVMLTIMGVATNDRTGAGGAGGLAIGLVYGACFLVGAPFTGASMNPARSFGPALLGGGWTMHWVYWVGPILGMIAAAWLYDFIRPSDSVPPGRPLGLQGPLQDA